MFSAAPGPDERAAPAEAAPPTPSSAAPSAHRPQFAPLTPDPRTGLLPAAPSDTKNFADLYPERRGRTVQYSNWDVMMGRNRESSFRRICENNVIKALEEMPMVRNAVGALKAQGCPFEWDRHVACDACAPGGDPVASRGGYDERANQVFVCANNCTSAGAVHAVLVRNLVSAFDACVARADPRNLDHLACTEVRKANLANCEFSAYLSRVDARPAVRGEHGRCVRKTAEEALVKAKFVEPAAAAAAVDRVFGRCYADLEPFGRRACGKEDIAMAHAERYLAGYM